MIDDQHFFLFFRLRDGLQWAHLCCALWIPEVTIVCSEKMEPIDNIDEIPVSVVMVLFL